ncbi:MAG: glycosyltransferase family 4 protein [Betaproteobacteria bacterium]|nr:glycosyltransferase family 4 protein [Betaproteobacteria bacterium]
MTEFADLSVLHLGAGRHRPTDSAHPTFEIWRSLAKGFRRYTVVNRSTQQTLTVIQEGNLSVYLIPSRAAREAEFLFTQFEALAIADRAEADVVISQSPVLGGWAGLAIMRRRGARHLVELHGNEFFKPASVFSKDWAIQRLSHPVLHRANRIRVLSDRMGSELSSKYGSRLTGRIVTLPPRVDLSKFKSKSSWITDARLKVVMVGTVNRNKGQHRLIDAVLSAGAPVDIWVVGDGPDLDDCRRTAGRLGAGDTVKFFGRVTHIQLADILLAADVFVQFSHQEGTPRAIMEAMAVGLPIVTTNAGFCADIVADGIEGFVLGPNPEGEVVGVLTRLLHDDALRAHMGQAAIQRATRDYDAVRLYGQYRALILETANS